MKKVLKSFGRYLLLDHLAQGGMAEIFRAWAPSVDDGGRLVVLKCVQPDFGQDTEFLQMFRSEIRVSIGLNHPNIVQLYDFGEVDARPYIAMEFVEGKSLKQLIQHLSRDLKRLPVEFSAYAIEQVAAGLHYAHVYRDRTTYEDLNIVHRDISPQNLLIGYSGNVKIIDFGIAKAASNRQTTRAGIIKGKPSYLSPEQITGEVLDGRSDVFSLGAVLWETLTGRKLFAGESDLAAIRLIEDCDRNVKPPSMVNPEVPEELDNIVFRALTHDRDARYKSAEEMQRALHRAIYNFKPSFDPSDFGTYLHELFKDEIEQEHKDLQMLNKEAKELFANNSFKSLPSLSNDFSAPSLSMQTRTEETTQPSDPHDIPKLPAARPKGMLNAESTGSREIDQDLLGMKNGEITLQNEFDTHAPTRPRDLYKRPKIKNPGDSSAIPKVILTIVVIAAGVFYVRPDILHTMLRYLNHHGQPAKEKTIPKPAEPIANDYGGHPLPVAPPEFSPTPVAPLPVSHEVGMLVIKTIPDGGLTKVVINDGETFSADRPIQVPLKTPLKMTISKPGFQPVVREMTITQEGQTNLDISFEPAKYGVMTIHATPSARLQLLMDGMHWTFNTPMDAVKMPPGNYRVQLANDMLGMGKTITFRLFPGQSIDQDVTLDVLK